MDIVIQRAAVEHVEAVSAICSFGWKQTVAGKLSEEYQNKNAAEWYNHERVRSDIEKGSYTYVATIDSEVAGVIGGEILKSGVSQVFVLYVDEKYRYQGIGSQLLKVFTEEHKEKGATEQWVSVQDGNDRGIPFYEARGFQLQEKRKGVTDTGEMFVNLQYLRGI
ncbi:GNAT family N-acetyltransferase [Oceanobacillus sp. CFH 90083]|uniref:GNAT family N-acetyltransferase n=1 Tax=Oceanobacillus sp. CFH 90083 TaxID=2592336 RepID=UPI00128E6B49|nr:GNAT family N-acetyltransferase [Oceanobacillus sp. CFH 90083]